MNARSKHRGRWRSWWAAWWWGMAIIQLVGCGSIPSQFLDAEREAYKTLAPFVSHSADVHTDNLNRLLEKETNKKKRAYYKRRLKLMKDHKRTLILWDYNLTSAEQARALKRARKK